MDESRGAEDAREVARREFRAFHAADVRDGITRPASEYRRLFEGDEGVVTINLRVAGNNDLHDRAVVLGLPLTVGQTNA